MNIAVIAADLFPDKLGGAEKHVVEVVKRLSKKHKILMFVGPDTSVAEEFSRSVQIIPVNYPKIPNFYGLAYILCGFPQVSQYLRKEKVEVLWAKQSFPQAPLAALLKKRFNIPLYTTVQNPMLHKEELVLKGRLLKPFHVLFTWFLTPIIKWSLSRSNIVAAVSKYSEGLANKMGARKVVIIPNGIDPKRFNILKKSDKKLFKIVTTSSLIPRNGIDTLIKAVALLSKEINWELQIAGEGPEEEKLQKLVNKFNLSGKVKFLGRVETNKIPQLLSQAEIFVRPSRWEGFGVSFVEAMAARIPVIATPVGGITDFIVHEKTGLLVSPNNPQELAKAIIYLWEDKNLYKKLQKQGQNLAIKKYNWDKISNEVEKQFIKLI